MASDTPTPTHGTGGNLGKVAGRSDQGKAILHTIDPDFILGIGRISEFGARKYHMRNFLMAPGMEWSRVYESLLRHLFLWWGGEELDVGPNGEFGPTDDPETNMKWSGMPHLLHVAWNVMVLYTYSRHDPYHGGDDRPGTLEYVNGDWQDWRGEFDAARGLIKLEEPVAYVEPLGPSRDPDPDEWARHRGARAYAYLKPDSMLSRPKSDLRPIDIYRGVENGAVVLKNRHLDASDIHSMTHQLLGEIVVPVDYTERLEGEDDADYISRLLKYARAK